MKVLKLFMIIAIVAFFSCKNSNNNNEHGHEHGPNGEHLHDHGEDGHTHDERHEQEVFEIGKDTIKVDSVQQEKHHHNHGDGHSHLH